MITTPESIFSLSPALYALLGALISYYGLERAWAGALRIYPFLGILALLLFLIALFRVLGDLPAACRPNPRSRRGFQRVCRAVTVLAVGFTLGFAARNAAAAGDLRLTLPPERVLGITGTLLDDPRGTASGGMGYLRLEAASASGGLRASARGRLMVFFPPEAIPRLKEFGRSSGVYLEGSLRESPSGAGAAGGQVPRFSAKSVHILREASALEQLRTVVRMRLLDQFAGRPWGALAAALILGAREDQSPEAVALAGAFKAAGCSHVLALSGMHLAIVSALIAFLLKRPLGLKPAALAGAFCIILYVYLVGPQPSLVRAAIMYLLGTAAILGAFPRQPLPLLALAFLIQIAADPLSGDTLSFILSYLALGGILIAGEALGDLFRGLIPPAIAQPLVASLGAFIATAGISAAAFGVLRPVGIGASFVIVPLSTCFMIAAIAYLGASFLLPPLGGLLSSLLSLLYRILEETAALAARVPALELRRPLVVSLLSVVLVIALVWFQARHKAWRERLLPFDG
ncbi:MAG: ComEC/Rec2 family competence protein [Spirochaetaceae bacterium]|jgi:competence protein ComEC|nr:ComEC/Rec2 family competence protein [Spirochaetaceae bacterium]